MLPFSHQFIKPKEGLQDWPKATLRIYQLVSSIFFSLSVTLPLSLRPPPHHGQCPVSDHHQRIRTLHSLHQPSPIPTQIPPGAPP